MSIVNWCKGTTCSTSVMAAVGAGVGQLFKNQAFAIAEKVFVMNPLNCAKAAAILTLATCVLGTVISKLTGSKNLQNFSWKPVRMGLCMGLGGITGAVGGVFNSYLFNTDRAITVKAFAVSAIAMAFLIDFCRLISNDGKKSTTNFRLFHGSIGVGQGVFGLAQIVAFRQFNIIATRGTVVLGAVFAMGVLSELSKAMRPEKDIKKELKANRTLAKLPKSNLSKL